ncbi:MAG TPA: cobalamin-independent methionine synthase II family protein [Burkholderiales bacterium]|nr:cobalamin-independent methionine synthase II family protein [Burkholderiales bacterium]
MAGGQEAARAGLKRSDTRILTTHAGSLPRPGPLVALQLAASRGEAVDPGALSEATEQATRRAVERQLACGIDVGNDGEQPRESFVTYVRYRLSGFSGESRRPPVQDIAAYPSFRALVQGRVSLLTSPPRATGEVRYADRGPLEREIAGYRKALDGQTRRFAESFWTAPSPGIVASAMQNGHYGSLPDYVSAVADALRTEYEAIVAAGFVLQIDAPDLAMERHRLFAGRPLAEFLDFVELVVSSLNRALANVPGDRVRLHVCWGNYEGPHTFDVPLEEIASRLYEAKAGALVLSMANPRHAHEHRTLARLPLPQDWNLVAGVIDTTTNYVEHPEVVADRIETAAKAVGDPRRVLAGTDCGFDTSTGFGAVAEEIVWEKLRALAEGARIASSRLWT